MRLVYALLGLLSVTVTAANVVVLSDKNFTQITASGPWVILFYAPWCRICQALDVVFSEVASQAIGHTKLGRIDATSETGMIIRCKQAEYLISV